MICNGRGANGTHCCFIAGKVCEFLDDGDIPRCSLYDQWGTLKDNPAWQAAPVGRFFARRYPGFECQDWPQNIPEVMEEAPRLGPFYTCCWGRGNRGNVD